MTLGQGIPLGGLEIKGFGGGVYRHMKREADIDVAMSQLQGGDIQTLGAGLSGLIYHFDAGTSIGFKASAIIATAVGDGEGFNANLTFGMEFGNSNTGGINFNRIFFEGVGKFMDAIDPGITPQFASNNSGGDNPFSGVAPPSGMSTTVKAFVLIDLNPVEKLYSARLGVYIGESESDFIYGRVHAAAEIDMANRKWWLHIGTPAKRNQVTINVLNTLKFELTSYFAIGNDKVPEVPAPYTGATEVDHILEEHFPAYNGRTGNLDNGAGFVFGAGLSFGTEEPKKFLFFYGHFEGGIGFDIGLTKQSSECTNSTGFKGWYAVGQAYAGFDAELGAEIRFMGLNKRIVILDALIAAGVKVEAPNPTWVKAAVIYDLNVLGLIKFNGKFQFEVGEHRSASLPVDCDISAPDPLAEIAEVIYSVSLEGGQTDNIYVGSDLLVELNIPNKREIKIQDEHGDTYAFRVNVFQVRILDEHGEEVAMGNKDRTTGWDSEQLIWTIGYINFWPANSTLTAEITGRIEELVEEGEESHWVFARNEETGDFYEEVKTLTFTTGDLVDVIPTENVKASYPLPGQKYFLINEYAGGYYMYLRSNQNYLFNEPPNGYEMKARFRNGDGTMLVDNVPFEFMINDNPNVNPDPDNRPGSTINISKIDQLQTDKDYIMELAWVKGETETPVEPYGEEYVLHRTPFHTSKFRNLAAKLEKIVQYDLNYQDGGNTYAENDILVSTQNTFELFEDYDLYDIELPGSTLTSQPLIRLEVVKKDCDWENWGSEDWYCNEAYYLDYAYSYLNNDCAVPESLRPPLDAVRLVQAEGAVDKFDLIFSFPAEVYRHAAMVYEYLDQNNSCAGQEPTPPVPPTPGGGGSPIPTEELPPKVRVLRNYLMNGREIDPQLAYNLNQIQLLTNITTIANRDPRNAAITLNANYAGPGDIERAEQQYRTAYDASSLNGASLNFAYDIGTATSDDGNTYGISYQGGGIITVDGTPVCSPQWVDEYCNYPILPADVYQGAEFEIQVTYLLPWRPTVGTSSSGTMTIKNL